MPVFSACGVLRSKRVLGKNRCSSYNENTTKKERNFEMKATIYCKNVQEGKLSFYVDVQGEHHYLFSRNFTTGVMKYFESPKTVEEAMDFSSAKRNRAIQRTMDKLPTYLKFVEREYGVEVFRKTARKNADRARRTA